jgi:hypothetical protein
LDHLILVVRNWPSDAHVGCVVSKPHNMHDFLSIEVTSIEKHKKLIKEKRLFEKNYNEI